MINTNFYSFDLDGVLASTRGRTHHRGADWSAYNDAGCMTAPILTSRTLLLHLAAHAQIVVNTARPRAWEGRTKTWLDLNGVHYDALVMRPTESASHVICKSANLLQVCNDPLGLCLGHFDDDQTTVAYMRELGFTAYQVCE